MEHHWSAYWNSALAHSSALERPPQSTQPQNSPLIATGDTYFKFHATAKQAEDFNPHVYRQFSESDSSNNDTQHVCTTNSECDKVTEIPIRAPVPLLYSQRDKAGLEAMEFIAQKGTKNTSFVSVYPPIKLTLRQIRPLTICGRRRRRIHMTTNCPSNGNFLLSSIIRRNKPSSLPAPLRLRLWLPWRTPASCLP